MEMKFTDLLNSWYAHKRLEEKNPEDKNITAYLAYLEARIEKVLKDMNHDNS
jgi:hypothetical protein